MKKYLLIFIFLLTISNRTFGQCDQDIVLSSQEAIDNFAADYGCTEILGDLKINEDESSIFNLSGLSGLTVIEGNLIIINNNLVTNIDGLSSLTSIGGSLQIRNSLVIALRWRTLRPQ